MCGKLLTHSSEPNAVLICQICGTRNRVIFQTNSWIVTGVSVEPEKEIRERTDEFARLRNYRFNELQERIIQALIRKREKNGDFFCPCKARLVLENVCPCKETRDGAVEDRGRCTCGLFWKQNPSV